MRLFSKFLILGLLAVPAFSLAGPLNVTFDKVDLGNDYTVNYEGQKINAFVGSLLFNIGTSKKEFVTFCVDLDHIITNGQTYQVTPVFTNTLSATNAYREAGDVLGAGYKTATDANHSAALQLAIWKTVYGSKVTFTGVSSTVTAEEQAYMTAGAKTNYNALYLQDYGTNCKGQSQITCTPEPSSYAFLGLGVLGFAVRRKKKA